MTPGGVGRRRQRRDTAAGFLASRSDSQLVALLDGGAAGEVGVGGGAVTLDIDGLPAFAKRVPLTDRELARPHCTANLFELPVFCQYGVRGVGFGAWREPAANRMVTAGVLAGEAASFSLLYHWRLLPGRPPIAAEHEDVDAVVAGLGGSPAVRVRLEALAAASWSLVLFFEHIPHRLVDWLREDPVGRAALFERNLSEIVAFLGERQFAERNATHDAGYAAMMLVNWLVTAVCGVPLPARGGPVERNEFVRRCAAGHLPHDVPPAIAEMLARHAPAAATMNSFYWRLFGGEVRAEFPGL